MPPYTYTANQIATAVKRLPQAVRKQLHAVEESGFKLVHGIETKVWEFSALPVQLRREIELEVRLRQCRSVDALLTAPRRQWQPPMPLDKIANAEIQIAMMRRTAFKPFLIQQCDPELTAEEWKARGVEQYRIIFGRTITPHYWDRLFQLFVKRDNGVVDWDNLAIYLSEKPAAKTTTERPMAVSLADYFKEPAAWICAHVNPSAPSAADQQAVWALALAQYNKLIQRHGLTAKKAARLTRQFLFASAPFLAPTQAAIWVAFKRRLDRWQPGDPEALADKRANNGDRPEYPDEDLRRLRHSAVHKNGGRIDLAWREEYRHLSEYTRKRHPFQPKTPRTLYRAINPILVKAAYKSKNERELKNLVGRLTLDHAGMFSMDEWAADDVTSNIEVAFTNLDGSVSLILPQIIPLMDRASRKVMGWSISNDKGPTGRLVCAAVKRSFRDHGVPSTLGLENGFTFGRSLAINGKEDEFGQTIVVGLASHGCIVRHFQKGNPTSKADLENSFNLLQNRMERHPGYGGRIQMFDGADVFKREQLLIRSGKLEATARRYTFEEFIQVFDDIVKDYNATPQYFGRLKGMSPDEAFVKFKNPHNPPMAKFTNQLHWLLDQRYQVTVKAGGVRFTHFGNQIQVRGGELPARIGEQLWAVVDSADETLVTFLSLDFSEAFTLEVCRHPSADESRIATGGGILAAESQKINQHLRAIKDKAADLRKEFGNPRIDLLALRRQQPVTPSEAAPERQYIVDPMMKAAGEAANQQRAAIREERAESQRQQRTANRLLETSGFDLPASGISKLTPEQIRKLREIPTAKDAQ